MTEPLSSQSFSIIFFMRVILLFADIIKDDEIIITADFNFEVGSEAHSLMSGTYSDFRACIDPENMQGTMTKEAEMLEQLYKNVKMGSDSIIKLLDKASDGEFKTDLTKQINGYESLAAKIKKRLGDMGVEAKEENVMVKLWSSVGMAMNTMMDSSDSHLAQLIAEGSTMGITDGIKLLRDYENTDVSEEALEIARDVIKFEENNLEKAKSYI